MKNEGSYTPKYIHDKSQPSRACARARASGTNGKTGGTDSERFILILAPLPHHAPIETRLRQALKVLLRSFGLRCVEVREESEPLRKCTTSTSGAAQPVKLPMECTPAALNSSKENQKQTAKFKRSGIPEPETAGAT
jgi:hypothetical protein